jgi:hypothetical protein
VSFHIKKDRDAVDEDTDGSMLANYSPVMAQFLKAVKTEKSRLEAQPGRAKGMSPGRTMQKVASVPEPVFQYLELVHGIDWIYSKAFMKWLRKHPEYSVGRTIVDKDLVK